MQKVIYYSDELNDDFSGIKRNTIEVGSDFKYIHSNVLWKTGEFIVYTLLLRPFAYIFTKIKFSVKFVNKNILKKYKNRGYFLYGNHTQIPGDAFIPNIMTFPKKPYFVVHPDNLSAPGTKSIMQMLGAIPLPTTVSGYKNFVNSLEKRTTRGNCVVIYPEAHVWPYYTKIRSFKETSFKYPVKFNDPVFCFTVTYQKRKYLKTPKITVFIDGPFLPDFNLKLGDRDKGLRDKVYSTMCKRSENSDYEFNKYIKKEDEN